MNPTLRYAIGSLLIAPLIGTLIGGLIGGICCLHFADDGYTFFFGLVEFAPFGTVTGLLFGLLSVGFLRKFKVHEAITAMTAGTLLGALPFAIFGLLPFAWLAGMVGYWFGFAAVVNSE